MPSALSPRASQDQLRELVPLLGISDTWRTKSRMTMPGVEALSILAARVSAPLRLTDLGRVFTRSAPVISMVTNELSVQVRAQDIVQGCVRAGAHPCMCLKRACIQMLPAA